MVTTCPGQQHTRTSAASLGVGRSSARHTLTYPEVKKKTTHHIVVLGRAAPCGELFRGAASSCGVRIPFWVEIKSSLMASVQAETQVLPAWPIPGRESVH